MLAILPVLNTAEGLLLRVSGVCKGERQGRMRYVGNGCGVGITYGEWGHPTNPDILVTSIHGC